MNKEEAFYAGLDLMRTVFPVYLSTINEKGFPEIRAMLNLRNASQYPSYEDFFRKVDDKCILYFTSNTSSRKVEQLRNNSKVSAYFCDSMNWKGLMLNGEIEIITDKTIKNFFWQEPWRMYYPGGPDDSDYTIFKLEPDAARFYHQLNFFTFEFK